MVDRVVLTADGKPTVPLEYRVLEGTWHNDNWISPEINLLVPNALAVSTVVVKVFHPSTAPRQISNDLTVVCAGQSVTHPLRWGHHSEVSLALSFPFTGDLQVTIMVREGMEPDQLDYRARGVVLSKICLRPSGGN
jgi:hypothetical protein